MNVAGIISLVFSLAGTVRTTIGAVTLDALLSEKESLTATATDYAVEDGANVSDHIKLDADILTISGVVTSSATSLFAAAGVSKLIETTELLRELRNARQPISIVTGVRVYNGYYITGLETSREASEGGLKIGVDLTLKKLTKVTLRQADIPADKTSPKAQGKAGQTKKPASKGGAKTTSKSSAAKTTSRAASSGSASSTATNSTRGKSVLAGVFGGK